MLFKTRNILLSLFIILSLFFISSPNVSARTLTISNHLINVNINTDGSMDVEEQITYNFSGKYNGVYKDINYNGASFISGLEILNGTSQTKLKNNNSGSPDTYSTEDLQGKTFKIKLYTPSENTNKTYIYKYKLGNVIKKYSDIAELNWKFISSENETPNDILQIIINVPKGANKEDLKIFAHGPLTGNSAILDNSSVKLSLSNLRTYTFVEARLLFPTSLISKDYPQMNYKMLQNILDQEAGFAKKANEEREEARNYTNKYSSKRTKISLLPYFFIAGTGLMLILLLPLGTILFVYYKYLQVPKPQINYDYYRELPGNYSPAVMSVLMNKTALISDVSATILDLVRRKYLVIEQEKQFVSGFFSDKETMNFKISAGLLKDIGELNKHEVFLIDWFINTLGSNGTADLNKIQAKLKSDESAAGVFRGKFNTWQALVKDEAVNINLIESSKAYVPTIVTILSIVVCVVSIFFNPLSFIFLVPLILMITSMRKTQYGLEQYYKWKAFKKYLKDFSLLNEAEVPSLVVWEHFLVYAVSLGVAKEVIEKLKLVIPAEEFENTDLIYLSDATFINSFSHFESSFNDISSASVANSSDSSYDGGGGGFSGGDSGGGGGSSDGGF